MESKRVSSESQNPQLVKKAMRDASAKYDKAIELMRAEKAPEDVLGYGEEFDEKAGTFKIRRKSGGLLAEYDEKTGTWI